MAFCKECGAQLPERAVFCEECGAPVPKAADTVQAGYKAYDQSRQTGSYETANQGYQAHQSPRPSLQERLGTYQVPPNYYTQPGYSQQPVQKNTPGSADTVVSVWAYIGLTILFAIPVIGWISCIVMSFAAENRNIRNLSRAYFVFLILGAIFWVLTYSLSLSVFDWITTEFLPI